MQNFHVKAPGKAKKNKIINSLKKEDVSHALACQVQEATKDLAISVPFLVTFNLFRNLLDVEVNPMPLLMVQQKLTLEIDSKLCKPLTNNKFYIVLFFR